MAGETGRVAHVVRGIVQRRRLGVACDEQKRRTDEGDEDHREKPRGRCGGGFCRYIHLSLLAVHPTAYFISFRMAGLLTRGSLRAFRLPGKSPSGRWKAARRLQSRGRLGLWVPPLVHPTPFPFQSGRFASIGHHTGPSASMIDDRSRRIRAARRSDCDLPSIRGCVRAPFHADCRVDGHLRSSRRVSQRRA